MLQACCSIRNRSPSSSIQRASTESHADATRSQAHLGTTMSVVSTCQEGGPAWPLGIRWTKPSRSDSEKDAWPGPFGHILHQDHSTFIGLFYRTSTTPRHLFYRPATHQGAVSEHTVLS